MKPLVAGIVHQKNAYKIYLYTHTQNTKHILITQKLKDNPLKWARDLNRYFPKEVT